MGGIPSREGINTFRSNGSRPDYDHSFDWLLPMLSSIDLSGYSGVYDRERVDSVNEATREHVKDPAHSRALWEKYRHLFEP